MEVFGAGTIVIGTTRDAFALLATDRMWSTHGNTTQYTFGFHRKIVLHPSLPIAIATCGITYIYKHVRRSRRQVVAVKVYAKSILKGLTRVGPDTVCFIESQYEKLILPGVIETRDKANEIGMQYDKCNVILMIASFCDGTPRLDTIGLLNGNLKTEKQAAFIQNPPSIDDLYKKSDTDNYTYAYFLGEHWDDPDRLSLHIRDSITKGIKAEAKMHGDQNRECGGTVDVALVDAYRARFIYLESTRTIN